MGLRRHVAEFPATPRGSLAGGPKEGLVVMMAGIIDVVDRGWPPIAAQAVDAVATGAVLVVCDAAGPGGLGKVGRDQARLGARRCLPIPRDDAPAEGAVSIDSGQRRRAINRDDQFREATSDLDTVRLRRAAIRPSMPMRWATEANSERWVTARLMPSTMMSMIR